jgi:hypothetical protein
VFLVNSCQRYFSCGPIAGQALFRSYGCFFAEFLGDVSLVRLRLLDVNTCVGLRYGSRSNKFRRFSWRPALHHLREVALPHFAHLGVCLWDFPHRTSSAHDVKSIMRDAYLPRPFITCHESHGILTVCPSGAVLTIPLGPTNPTTTIVAGKPCSFDVRVSHPHCGYLCQHSYFATLQQWVTPSAFTQMRILSYRSHCRR